MVGSEEDEDGGVHDVRHEQDDGKREEEHGLSDDVQIRSALCYEGERSVNQTKRREVLLILVLMRGRRSNL